MTKIQSKKLHIVPRFEISNFRFVSDFDIRASNFQGLAPKNEDNFAPSREDLA